MSETGTPNPDADGLVGAITAYAGETLPGPKYRWCHGTQTLSRTEFSLLFSRLGESWGAGDGSTTFNLPNMDGRMPVGFNDSDTDFDAVGGTGGTKAATMPTHGHTLTGAPGGTFITTISNANVMQSGASAVPFSASTGSPTIGTLAVGDAGGSGDNMPPFATVRYLIKVA
jgi:microcystin-dependent protein